MCQSSKLYMREQLRVPARQRRTSSGSMKISVKKRCTGSSRQRSGTGRKSCDQLWDYKSETWARWFFDNRKAQLRWQRLKPYEKFAAMIDRHWDGIAAYCKPANQIALGYLEGLNYKVHVFSAAPTDCATKNISNLKSLPRACTNYEKCSHSTH